MVDGSATSGTRKRTSEDDETSETSESSADTQEEPEKVNSKVTIATSADHASPELMPPSATIASQETHAITHHGSTSPLMDSSPQDESGGAEELEALLDAHRWLGAEPILVPRATWRHPGPVWQTKAAWHARVAPPS